MVAFEKKGLLLITISFSCALGTRTSYAASPGAAASGSLSTITKNLNQAYQSLGGSLSSNAQDGSSAQSAFPAMETAISKLQTKLKDVKSNVNNMISQAKNLEDIYKTGSAQDVSPGNAQLFLSEIKSDWGYVKGDWKKIESNWKQSNQVIQGSLDSANQNLDDAKNLFVPVGTDLGAINRALEAFKNQSSDAFASASRGALKKSRDDIALRRNNLLSRQSSYGQASNSCSSVQQGLGRMIKEGYALTFTGTLSGRIGSECLTLPQSGGDSASNQFAQCVQDLKSYKQSVTKESNSLGTIKKDLEKSQKELLTKP